MRYLRGDRSACHTTGAGAVGGIDPGRDGWPIAPRDLAARVVRWIRVRSAYARRGGSTMFLAFQQSLDPIGNVLVTTLAALVPVALLLVLLAVFRVTAWLAVLIGSVVTFLLGVLIWGAPLGGSL